MPTNLSFVDCTREEHAAGILYILNDAIVTTTALYDYRPRTPDTIASFVRLLYFSEAAE